MGATEMATSHPYVPITMELPGFTPAMMTQAFILGTYGLASVVVVLVVWLFSGLVCFPGLLYIPLFCSFYIPFLARVGSCSLAAYENLFLVVSCRFFLKWFLKMGCGCKQLVNWHIGCGSGTVVVDCGWHSFCTHFEQRL